MITTLVRLDLGDTDVTQTVHLTTIGSPGPQGASAQSAGIVVLSDDDLSVTAVVGSYALVSEGTVPYPHVIIRTGWD